MKMRVMRHGYAICFVLVAAIAAACVVHAQQADYSSGFRKFHTLGLPSVEGGKYVKLEVYAPGSQGMWLHMFRELNLAGNAWMIEENKEGTSRFVTPDGRTIEAYDLNFLQKLRIEESKKEGGGKKGPSGRAAKFMQPQDQRTGAKWKEADEAKDLEKILKQLNEDKDKNRYDRMEHMTGGYGAVMLLAIQYHSRGHTNEANRIVEKIFERAGVRQKVIMQALNALADAKYDEIINAFFKDENQSWEQFAGELGQHTKRFAVGWQKALAAKRLADNVLKRAAQTAPPEPAGEGLADEDRTLALDLAEMKTDKTRPQYFGYGYDSGCQWLLYADARKKLRETQMKNLGLDEPIADSAVDKILDRGMRSMPLLLALLKDDYMLRMDLSQITHNYYGYSSYYGADEISEERISQMYDSMRRPVTRSDIAAHVLRGIVPRSDEMSNLNTGDRDALHDACSEWYKANKDKTPIELAKIYMNEGDSSQKQIAMGYIMKRGEENDRKALEAKLLEFNEEDLFSNSHMIQQYVTQRGPDGAEFVAQFEKKLNELKEDNASEMFNDENFVTQMNTTLDSLKKLVSAEPLETMLEKLHAGETTWEESGQQVYQRLGRKKNREALTILLENALKAKDPRLSGNLLTATSGIGMNRYGGYNVFAELESEPEEKEGSLEISEHAELWKKLLADKRAMEAGGFRSAVPVTLGQLAAWMIESLYDEERGRSAGQVGGLIGDRMYPILFARAEARLEGKKGEDLPAYPSADNVGEERRKQIVDQISGVKGAALDELVGKLALDELLALAVKSQDNEELNKAMAPLANRIVKVHGETKDKAALDTHQSLVGKQLSKAAVDQVRLLCEETIKKGNILVCTVMRQPALAGTVLHVREIEPADKEFKKLVAFRQKPEERKLTYVTASLSGGAGRLYASARWDSRDKAEPEQKEAKEENLSDEDEMLLEMTGELDEELNSSAADRNKTFYEALERFCGGEGNVFMPAGINITGMPQVPADMELEAVSIPHNMMF